MNKWYVFNYNHQSPLVYSIYANSQGGIAVAIVVQIELKYLAMHLQGISL